MYVAAVTFFDFFLVERLNVMLVILLLHSLSLFGEERQPAKWLKCQNIDGSDGDS